METTLTKPDIYDRYDLVSLNIQGLRIFALLLVPAIFIGQKLSGSEYEGEGDDLERQALLQFGQSTEQSSAQQSVHDGPLPGKKSYGALSKHSARHSINIRGGDGEASSGDQVQSNKRPLSKTSTVRSHVAEDVADAPITPTQGRQSAAYSTIQEMAQPKAGDSDASSVATVDKPGKRSRTKPNAKNDVPVKNKGNDTASNASERKPSNKHPYALGPPLHIADSHAASHIKTNSRPPSSLSRSPPAKDSPKTSTVKMAASPVKNVVQTPKLKPDVPDFIPRHMRASDLSFTDNIDTPTPVSREGSRSSSPSKIRPSAPEFVPKHIRNSTEVAVSSVSLNGAKAYKGGISRPSSPQRIDVARANSPWKPNAGKLVKPEFNHSTKLDGSGDSALMSDGTSDGGYLGYIINQSPLTTKCSPSPSLTATALATAGVTHPNLAQPFVFNPAATQNAAQAAANAKLQTSHINNPAATAAAGPYGPLSPEERDRAFASINAKMCLPANAHKLIGTVHNGQVLSVSPRLKPVQQMTNHAPHLLSPYQVYANRMVQQQASITATPTATPPFGEAQQVQPPFLQQNFMNMMQQQDAAKTAHSAAVANYMARQAKPTPPMHQFYPNGVATNPASGNSTIYMHPLLGHCNPVHPMHNHMHQPYQPSPVPTTATSISSTFATSPHPPATPKVILPPQSVANDNILKPTTAAQVNAKANAARVRRDMTKSEPAGNRAIQMSNFVDGSQNSENNSDPTSNKSNSEASGALKYNKEKGIVPSITVNNSEGGNGGQGNGTEANQKVSLRSASAALEAVCAAISASKSARKFATPTITVTVSADSGAVSGIASRAVSESCASKSDAESGLVKTMGLNLGARVASPSRAVFGSSNVSQASDSGQMFATVSPALLRADSGPDADASSRAVSADSGTDKNGQSHRPASAKWAHEMRERWTSGAVSGSSDVSQASGTTHSIISSSTFPDTPRAASGESESWVDEYDENFGQSRTTHFSKWALSAKPRVFDIPRNCPHNPKKVAQWDKTKKRQERFIPRRILLPPSIYERLRKGGSEEAGLDAGGLAEAGDGGSAKGEEMGADENVPLGSARPRPASAQKSHRADLGDQFD